MADLSGYTPIYIRTTGDDATGDGSSGSPYATAQKGYDIAAATSSGNYVLDFGAGSFGGITLTANWPSRISVQGAGSTSSFLGGINAVGQNAVYDFSQNGLGDQISPATSGYSINITGNNAINISEINTTGGSTTDPYQNYNGPSPSIAGAGGSVTLTNLKCENINTSGGNANGSYTNFFLPSGGGVVLTNVICGTISSNGATFSADYLNTPNCTGGSGANVSLTNSTVGDIFTVGAPAGENGGNGGSVTLSGSTAGSITNNGAQANTASGGNGGGVTLSSTSTCGNVSNFGGSCGGSGSPGGGGAVTLSGTSTCANITNYGGSSTGSGSGAGGGSVTLSGSSTCANITNCGGNSSTSSGAGVGGNVTLSQSSTCGNIFNYGGEGLQDQNNPNTGGIGGYGGNTSLSNSTCGNVTSNGGITRVYGTSTSNGGNFTATSSTAGIIDLSGGFNTTLSTYGNVGTISQTGSTFGTWLNTFYLSGDLTTLNNLGTGFWSNSVYIARALVSAIPSVVHVSTSGSDTVRVNAGTESAPFASAQYAYNVVLNSTTGNRTLNFGSGNFGGITLTNTWPSRISVQGVSSSASNLGGITGNGANQVYDYANNVEISAPTSGYSVDLTSNKTVNVGNISVNGGNVSADWQYGTVAQNGGSVTLNSVVCGNIDVSGGNVNGTNSGSGGNGGAVSLTSSVALDIVSNGLSGLGGGTGGQPGSVQLSANSTCGNITVNGGSGVMNAGSGGAVTLNSSTSANITSNAGILSSANSSLPGGAITLISSQCGDIVSNGSDAGNQNNYAGGGGTISLTNSVAANISTGGGNNPGNGYFPYVYVGANGGPVNLTNSRCLTIASPGGTGATCNGERGTVTLSGYTIMPNTINAGFIDANNLLKGRGVNGSNILGLI